MEKNATNLKNILKELGWSQNKLAREYYSNLPEQEQRENENEATFTEKVKKQIQRNSPETLNRYFTFIFQTSSYKNSGRTYRELHYKETLLEEFEIKELEKISGELNKLDLKEDS